MHDLSSPVRDIFPTIWVYRSARKDSSLNALRVTAFVDEKTMRNGIVIDYFKSTGKYENLLILPHPLPLSKHFQLA